VKDIKKWILKNIDIKLISLFLAIIIWTYVASGENPIIENYIDIPLSISNLQKDLAVKEIPEKISIGIKGPKNILNKISPEEFLGTINLSEINQKGIYKINVEINAPQRVEIIRIIPSEIKVEIEKISSKTMGIDYSLMGIPGKGYSLAGEPEFNISKIEVTGTESKLNLVKQVICPIDISGIIEDTILKIKVKALDINDLEMTGLQIEPDELEVSIYVTQEYPEKIVMIKPKIIGKPAPGYYISQILIAPEEIKIYGNYSKINDLDFLETIPIDVNGITKTLSVKVPAVLGEGIYMYEEEPDLVEVNIQVKENIVQKTLENIPVVIEDASPFISISFEPRVANIIIKGKSVTLDEIDRKSIKVYVKFSEDLKTNQEVPLEVMLPEGVSLVAIDPANINLKISE